MVCVLISSSSTVLRQPAHKCHHRTLQSSHPVPHLVCVHTQCVCGRPGSLHGWTMPRRALPAKQLDTAEPCQAAVLHVRWPADSVGDGGCFAELTKLRVSGGGCSHVIITLPLPSSSLPFHSCSSTNASPSRSMSQCRQASAASVGHCSMQLPCFRCRVSVSNYDSIRKRWLQDGRSSINL